MFLYKRVTEKNKNKIKKNNVLDPNTSKANMDILEQSPLHKRKVNVLTT